VLVAPVAALSISFGEGDSVTPPNPLHHESEYAESLWRRDDDREP